jgi:hypothetical protein
MAPDGVDALHDHPVFGREDFDDLAMLSLIPAGDGVLLGSDRGGMLHGRDHNPSTLKRSRASATIAGASIGTR